MEFSGQVWFTFGSPDDWLFYRFVRSVAESGVPTALDWQPMPHDDERLAMSVLLGITEPEARGRFLHAMFGLVHLESRDVTDPDTVADAARAAGIVAAPVESGDLEQAATAGAEIGVSGTPTLYRHGPPMHVRLNPSALTGDPRDTLQTILAMSDNDGIWELRKP